MQKIFIETYGCSNSQAEAEVMAGLLKRAGFEITEEEADADLIIAVTCYVKNPTEQKIIFRLKNVQKKLIVAGCMPEGIYSKLLRIVPSASLVSTHHVKDIVQAVEKTLQGKKVEYLGKAQEVNLCLPRMRRNPVIDIVPISSGCNSTCTYCCVRLAKGKLFSYPENMIIQEIRESLKEGCKEVWLTAQDTASYGYDGSIKLPKLLKGISDIPEKFRVRVGMMNPKNVIPIASDLVKAFEEEKIYKFVHLPIQSGSDAVLASMNRDYEVSEFEEIVELFRKSSRYQIWTDVIVGYPTEKEEDFLETLKIIKKVKPDWVNLSKFGARPGTEAAKLKPLPPDVVKERSRKASELVKRVPLEKNKEWLGWEGEVLVSETGKTPGQWIGRNFAYKPVLIENSDNILGKFIKVRITNFNGYYLSGEPLT
jgi:MiaB-like tRNA modifying enzyme